MNNIVREMIGMSLISKDGNWIKKIGLLCTIVVCMFLTGCSGNNGFAQMKDGTYDNNGTPFYLETNNEFSEAYYNMVIKNYNEIPEYLKRNCKGVHLMSEDKFYREHQGAFNNEIAGFARLANLEIYLNKKYLGTELKLTMAHELGHIYDFTHGLPGVDTSQTDEFIALFNSEKNKLEYKYTNNPAYYSSSSDEFFAQCFAYYVTYPDELTPALKQYYDSLPK